MAPQYIPDGYGVAIGRGQERARQALDAAVAAGYPEEVVRTVSDGFLLPEKALKIIEDQDADLAKRQAELAPDDAEGSDEPVLSQDSPVDEPQPDQAPPADSEPDPDAPETPEGNDVVETPQPAKNASTADWVAYAQTKGYDEAEGLNRDALIERYGA